MDTKIKESYTKDGKQLFELIQEWMEENNCFLYCKSEQKNVEHCRR